ncbi:HD domain-containing protein, partial [Streptomyces sp. NPDC005141]
MSEDLTAVARFLYEAGTLKNTARTGWWMAGVKEPESVADHSWRTALIATIIAKLEGADPPRAAFLAVWHDSQETRTGDAAMQDGPRAEEPARVHAAPPPRPTARPRAGTLAP